MKGRIIGSLAVLSIIILLSLISADLSTDLWNYYKLDEPSGTSFYDAKGYLNGTIGNNVSLLQTGIINYSHLWYNNSGLDNTSSETIAYPYTYSTAFWFKSNLNSSYGWFSDNTWNLFKTTDLSMSPNGQASISGYVPNTWNFVAVAIQQSPENSYSSMITVWVNGVKKLEHQYWECYISFSQVKQSRNFQIIFYAPSNQLFIYRDFGSYSDCDSQRTSGSHTFKFGNLGNNYGTNYTDKYVQFDEVQVYKGYYFTTGDVAYLYNNGIPPSYQQILTRLPQRKENFSSGTLGLSATYFINGYYENYERFNVSWFDSTTNSTMTLSKAVGEERTTIEGDLKVYLDGVMNSGDVTFKLENLNKSKTVNFTVRAINNNGYNQQQFWIHTEEIPEFLAGGLFSTVIKGFTDIFPDKESLGSSERFAYALFIMIITVVAILVVGKENISLALILASVISIMEFIYFVFIGYISIGIVIILVLIGIVLTYFKFRGV